MNRMKFPSTTQNLNAMDPTTQIVDRILEAGANGNIATLRALRRKINDDKEFRKLCDDYSDFSNGRNVLHHAAAIGNFEICRFLLKTIKVFVDTCTYRRETPLILAAEGEHVKIVDFLLSQDACISLADSKGYTAMHYAVLKDNMELLEMLQIKGVILDADSVDGTPLQIAASHGNVEVVKFLLSHGAKANCNYILAETPLACAIKSRSFECMNLLLKANAEPNKCFFGLSPLKFAAEVEGDTRFLWKLLEAGADPNSLLTDIFKPIEDAAMARNREAVEILFPLTEPLEHYPEWSVDGIMEYANSEEFKTKIQEKRTLRLEALGSAGLLEASLYEYERAILHYRMAVALDPTNREWIARRSLCHAHTGKAVQAMFDAEECVRRCPSDPRCPFPQQVGDAGADANEIYMRFVRAGFDLMVHPSEDVIIDAFRVAMFDYFACLYQMSSAREILTFYPDD